MSVSCADEVHIYSSMRYVSYTEACWHNFGFQCHWSSHSVEQLAIHLPGQQCVRFQENANSNDVRRVCGHTQLTRFFELCALPETRHAYPDLKYADVVYHYGGEETS